MQSSSVFSPGVSENFGGVKGQNPVSIWLAVVSVFA
jgi:hypothetical protein